MKVDSVGNVSIVCSDQQYYSQDPQTPLHTTSECLGPGPTSGLKLGLLQAPAEDLILLPEVERELCGGRSARYSGWLVQSLTWPSRDPPRAGLVISRVIGANIHPVVDLKYFVSPGWGLANIHQFSINYDLVWQSLRHCSGLHWDCWWTGQYLCLLFICCQASALFLCQFSRTDNTVGTTRTTDLTDWSHTMEVSRA